MLLRISMPERCQRSVRNGPPLLASSEAPHAVPDRPAHERGGERNTRHDIDHQVELDAAPQQGEESKSRPEQEICSPGEGDLREHSPKGMRRLHLCGKWIRFLRENAR